MTPEIDQDELRLYHDYVYRTPEQAKAIELVNKYMEETNLFTGNEERHSLIHSKRCSIICIDEIISIVKGICEAFGSEPDDYWTNVKNEILKLCI